MKLLDKLAGWAVWALGGSGVLIGAWALWATTQRRQAAIARKVAVQPADDKHRRVVVEHEAAERDKALADIAAGWAELATVATMPPSDRRSDELAAALNRR